MLGKNLKLTVLVVSIRLDKTAFGTWKLHCKSYQQLKAANAHTSARKAGLLQDFSMRWLETICRYVDLQDVRDGFQYLRVCIRLKIVIDIAWKFSPLPSRSQEKRGRGDICLVNGAICKEVKPISSIDK